MSEYKGLMCTKETNNAWQTIKIVQRGYFTK